MRKKRVRITRRVKPPTAAVAMTKTCPCSVAISDAGIEMGKKSNENCDKTHRYTNVGWKK